MFGPCKVCLSKDERIADLKAQITYLQGLISPKVIPVNTPLAIEANQLLDGGSSQVIDLMEKAPEQDDKEMSAVEKQAFDLLTGNYN